MRASHLASLRWIQLAPYSAATGTGLVAFGRF